MRPCIVNIIKFECSISYGLCINTMSYRRVYDVHLMDDLHNYFPAILYEPERFTNIPQIMTYFKAQMREHFNIFRRESRYYSGGTRDRRETPSPPRTHYHYQSTARMPPAPAPPVAPQPLPRPGSINRGTLPQNVPRPLIFTPAASQGLFEQTNLNLANLLREYIVPPGNPNLNILGSLFIDEFNNMEPVVVRPTAEQISSATTIISVTEENDTCSICQDDMEVGTEVRNINACNHHFHTGCIDTWFSRNVGCPVCRHDIRSV